MFGMFVHQRRQKSDKPSNNINDDGNSIAEVIKPFIFLMIKESAQNDLKRIFCDIQNCRNVKNDVLSLEKLTVMASSKTPIEMWP